MQLKTFIQPRFQSNLWAGERGNPTSLNYVNEIDNERNYFLWNLLISLQPHTIVEIGSSLGSKLVGLARSHPELTVVGLDINPNAIAKGMEIASSENLKNLTFLEFDATKSNLNDLHVKLENTVFFTWATLIYIHPLLISKLLKSIVDSGALGFVFIEQHSSAISKIAKTGKLINHGPNFVRDYEYLLGELDNSSKYSVEILPVDSKIWSPGGGNQSVIIGRRLKTT